MLVSEFDYELPPELIAQHPIPQRSASRLLRLDAKSGALQDLKFADFPQFLDSRDAVVLNDTRVVKARLVGRKASGGKIELFVERALGAREALALIKSSHPPAPGSELIVQDLRIRVDGREGELYRVRFPVDIDAVLERLGAVPLPPYIKHAPDAEDAERYQTVYAEVPGAVAAPTAGLHFDQAMIARLDALGVERTFVTLHVGAGTFQPMRGEEVETHRLHAEHLSVSADTCARIAAAKRDGRRVVAIGTTVVRALESAADGEGRVRAGVGETSLMIRPGYQFRVVDRLLTNFHLPRSTLLMLVCAFAGRELIMEAYRHAIRERYRFYSYGDAMVII
jgi:S-adenosylmethionine:tRNA ribosyltransferase-isomerase